jgi:hypothetical protein
MSNDASSNEQPSGFLSLVCGLFLIAAVIASVSFLLSRPVSVPTVDQERAAKRIATREQIDKVDSERINGLAWIDKSKGSVHLPIGRARELVVKELAGKKPAASSVPVEPSLPPPAPFDPDAAEPAPPALPSSPQGANTIRFPVLPKVNAAAAPVPAPQGVSPQTNPAPAPAAAGSTQTTVK